MDRKIVYNGAIPSEVDVLETNRNALIGLGMLALDVLGPGTLASGLSCTQTAPASMSVSIAPGRLYTLQNVDNTAYSTLGTDTAVQISKQGILFSAAQLACSAPVTAGFSVNYLIEATYLDVDGEMAVLPYYNQSNPGSAWSGANNNGVAQPTSRQGILSLQAKPGIAAATGTQATPAADAGYVGLWVVTIAFGQTTIVTANISQAANAPFITRTLTQPPASLAAGSVFDITLAPGSIIFQMDQTMVRSPEEIAANITPVNYGFHFLNPMRYGAVGDGTNDDSAGMIAWTSVLNVTTNPVAIFPQGKTFLCAPLPAFTANNITIKGNGCTIRAKPNSWLSIGDGSNHLQFLSNAGHRVDDMTLDGNQANFSTGTSWTGRMLELNSAMNYDFVGVKIINSPLQGMRLNGSTGIWTNGRFTNCNFDSNANLGYEVDVGSYITFTNCTNSYNGAGFQGVWADTVGSSAFGGVFRYRSHHITLVGCEAKQNSRDGFCVNQGSYAITFMGCRTFRNNDGGFTVAADAGSLTGSNESPYDLHYYGCEAYNNWASGLAVYVPIVGLTVKGGRYYNNHRVAGLMPPPSGAAEQPSFDCGIYVAGGSIGIDIDTRCEDDRQICPITSASAGAVAATGWIAGTMAYYTRLAFYDTNRTFQGYATITAESAGLVAFTATPYNGVTFSAITAGWTVTQKLQHNGAFLDNGSQGEMHVNGFGFLPGCNGPAVSGYKMLSGNYANGQNVILPKCPLDYNELLSNATFDTNGTGWAATGGSYPTGGSGVQISSGTIRSAGGFKLIGGTSAASGADGAIISSYLQAVQGGFVELSGWCFATNPSDATLQLFITGGSPNYAVFFSQDPHPGGGWAFLRVGCFIDPGATALDVRINAAAGKTTYWDSMSLRTRNVYSDQRAVNFPTRNLPY